MTLKTKLKLIPQGEINMGLTHVVVRLFNAPSPDTYNADFLVDRGAMDTMAPSSALRKIGIQPVGTDVYELANGEVVEWEYGNAEMEFMGTVVPTRIIFGPDDSEPILGIIALQTAGFVVDPKNETLRKLRARPLKRVA